MFRSGAWRQYAAGNARRSSRKNRAAQQCSATLQVPSLCSSTFKLHRGRGRKSVPHRAACMPRPVRRLRPRECHRLDHINRPAPHVAEAESAWLPSPAKPSIMLSRLEAVAGGISNIRNINLSFSSASLRVAPKKCGAAAWIISTGEQSRISQR